MESIYTLEYIVTVVIVASTLVGLRNSIALLFRELGTDNIFAYHLDGEPYSIVDFQETKTTWHPVGL